MFFIIDPIMSIALRIRNSSTSNSLSLLIQEVALTSLDLLKYGDAARLDRRGGGQAQAGLEPPTPSDQFNAKPLSHGYCHLPSSEDRGG